MKGIFPSRGRNITKFDFLCSETVCRPKPLSLTFDFFYVQRQFVGLKPFVHGRVENMTAVRKLLLYLFNPVSAFVVNVTIRVFFNKQHRP